MMHRSRLPGFLCAGTVVALLAGCGVYRSGSSAQTNSSGLAPTVIGVANQVNGVAPNRAIGVVFSQDMDPRTIDAQSFFIQGVRASVSYDANGRVATLVPDHGLEPDTQYTATVTTGVANQAGVHMARNYVSSFTTRATQDTTPPRVMSIRPAIGANCVDVNAKIVVIFSEGLDPATVNSSSFQVDGVQGTVTYDAVNIAATFKPSAPLQANTTYTGRLTTGIADLADVAMTAPVTFSFTTGPCGPGGTPNTFVYVGGFPAGNVTRTKIAGFRIAPDGRAIAVPGSTYTLPGSPADLAASPSGKFLFADVGGPTAQSTGGTYYTYLVGANGSLSVVSTTKQVANEPIFGIPPEYVSWVATDRTGATLYSEQGYGGTDSGYQWTAEYSIGPSGSLSLIGALGGNGTPISFTPDDHYGYHGFAGAAASGTAVIGYARRANGTLKAVYDLYLGYGQPVPGGLPEYEMPYETATNPAGNYLAVAFIGGATSGVAVYHVNSDGSLGAPTAYLPLTTSFSAEWTLTWDSTGTYLFASGAGNIYDLRFDSVTNTVAVVSIIPVPGLYNPTRMVFLNGHLFGINPNVQILYVYDFSNGVLSPAPSGPVPLGFIPVSVAALQQ